MEWSRFQPTRESWVTETGDWYAELIAECERLGLQPMLTLHHFTIPQWLAEHGGLLHPEFPALFQSFVSRVVKRLGARVPLWCTVNEPITWIIGQYIGGFMPPARFAPTMVPLACQNLFRAHVLAYETIHREVGERQGPWAKEPLMVGYAHNMVDFLPSRDWHPLERMMTWTFRRFYNRSWIDATVGKAQHFGVRGILPFAGQVTEARGRRTTDFIGINYYTKCYLQWGKEGAEQLQEGSFARPDFVPMNVRFSGPFDEVSDLGWAIHPAGLGRMLRFVGNYGLPIYITENGIADSTDKRRLAYLQAHLLEVARAIERGIDIRGYFHWSLIDNFEWIKGFWPRFGLVEINYDNFERRVRPSAEKYREVITAHQTRGREKPSTALLRELMANS